METEHAFNLRQISMGHAESLRTIHMNYSKEIEELKEKIEVGYKNGVFEILRKNNYI